VKQAARITHMVVAVMAIVAVLYVFALPYWCPDFVIRHPVLVRPTLVALWNGHGFYYRERPGIACAVLSECHDDAITGISDELHQSRLDPAHGKWLSGVLERAQQPFLGTTCHMNGRAGDEKTVMLWVIRGNPRDAVGKVLCVYNRDDPGQGVSATIAPMHLLKDMWSCEIVSGHYPPLGSHVYLCSGNK
jgi:hypothetical protein